MSEVMNLQDAILKEVRREKVPVTLFLMNGFQLGERSAATTISWWYW